jgi:hypothetical protein
MRQLYEERIHLAVTIQTEGELNDEPRWCGTGIEEGTGKSGKGNRTVRSGTCGVSVAERQSLRTKHAWKDVARRESASCGCAAQTVGKAQEGERAPERYGSEEAIDVGCSPEKNRRGAAGTVG